VTILPLLAHAAVVASLSMPAVPAASHPQEAVAPTQHIEGHFHEGQLGKEYLEVEQALRCDCGCGLDVHSCQFQMQCGTSPVWSERIRDQLNQGQTPEAIKAGFVAEFGETVLMAPPPEGFNLVGYLLPGFAILGAGVLVGLVAKGGTATKEQLAPVLEVSDEEEARLAAELRRLEEAESPDW
jgi:cytochrome c-type biogenesis protein CcmH